MNLNEFENMKGVVAIGEFDELGTLRSFHSRTLTGQQADSTSRLSGSLVSLLETITSLYTNYCGVNIAPFQSVTIQGLEYSLILQCGSKACIGVIVKDIEVNLDSIKKRLDGLCNYGK
jgi:roadblock/LC7 domain-containing protein